MSNQYLKLRRSGVPGKIPTTSSLDYGEIALNTYDGLAFMKKSGSNGEEVVPIGAPSGSFSGDFTGQFSGSFSGSGANLFNIPASGIVGLNLSQISSGSYSASISEDGLLVNNRVVAESFTGSLFGTASWANNALTASFAPAYLPLTGGTINGDVTLNGTASIAFLNVTIQSSSVIYSSGSNIFGDSTQDTQTLVGTVLVSGSQSITGSLIVSGGITGSLLGTSSWAVNSITASFVTSSNVFGPFGSNSVQSASYAVSSSQTETASFASTASYVNPLYQTVVVSGAVRLDPSEDPGNIFPSSTFLYQSSSNTLLGNDLYIRQNGNVTKFKWVESMMESGLLYGGVVTYSGSYVYVSEGSGIIVSHNATTSSEVGPIIDYVTWNDITQSVVNISSSQVTYLYIDDTGALQQQQSRFTPQQYHEYIPLGAVGHFDYTQVSAFGGLVQTAYDQTSQLANFVDAFGPLRLSGYGLTGQSGSLSLSVTSGNTFLHGGFYAQNPKYPSDITTPAQPTASIARVYRSGSGVFFDTNAGALYTTIDPASWDDGSGTPQPLSNNNWSIQRVFSDPKTGILYVYYGQQVHTTLLNALQSLTTETFTEGDTFDFTTFIGFLVVKSNTTDLTNTTDNKIVPAGLFRGSGQGSGGGAPISNIDDLTDVSIVSPVTGQALIYNAGVWINGNPTSASYAVSSSHAKFAESGNGSFSGSFSGSGANLFGIPASGIVGLNLSQISSGSVSASISPATGLQVNTNVTAPSFTGSLFGTASSAISASFAPNVYNTNGTLSGARTLTLGGNSLDISGSSTTRFFANGRVGIGTTTDGGFQLDVNGTARISGNLTLTGGALISTSGGASSKHVFRNNSAQGWLGFMFVNGVLANPSGNELLTVGLSSNGFRNPLYIGSSFNVNTNLPDINESAALQVDSTSRGFLPPRTSNPTLNITSSAQGLISYATSSAIEGLYYFNSGSYQGWTRLLNSSGSQTISGSLSIGDSTVTSVYETRRIASTTVGVNVIYSLPTSSFDGVFVDYTIRSGSVGRAGNFMAMWSGSQADFTDNSINGFGNTTGFVFGASISGSSMIVTGSGITGGWNVKTIIRSI